MAIGRPKGALNKATADVRKAAQKYTTRALSRLAHIMENGESEAAQVAAAKELLDRGHGKSTQPISGQMDVTHHDVKAEELDDDALAHIASGGGGRAAAKANGAAGPDRVH